MNKTSKLKLKEWQGKIADQRTKDRGNYPGAPSAGPGIMKIYEELLLKAVGRKKNWHACVLGATPELRDLILKHGGNLTTLDISLEMIAKCTALMKQNSNQEVMVKGDWLGSPLANNYFDVILGDGISNNIAYKDQSKLFKEIKRILKKNGRLILREGSKNPDRPKQTVEQINQDFVTNKIHWFDVLFNLYFYSEISDKLYNKKTYQSYLARLFNHIKKAHQQKRLGHKAFIALWWFRGNIVHTFMPRPLLEKLITKQFTLLPTKQAQDFEFAIDTMTFRFAKPKN